MDRSFRRPPVSRGPRLSPSHRRRASPPLLRAESIDGPRDQGYLVVRSRSDMLKISQKTEYAMRAVVELAVRRAKGTTALVSARAIAEAQHIPLRFLEQQL